FPVLMCQLASLESSDHHRYLHSFPTRRSSDLEKENIYARDLRHLIDYRREENDERLWNIAQSIIPTSSIDRITRGYHAEDKIVMDRVLRRVGIDRKSVV